MIVLRNKTFGREKHRTLREDEKFKPDPKLLEIYRSCEIVVESTKKFSLDKQKLGPIDKKKVDQLKKDIKGNYLYEDGPAGGETEFLDFPGDKSHLMSKKIDNQQHRFNYRVYEPEEISENGELKYIQRVVYESCWGHETNSGRTYSEKDN